MSSTVSLAMYDPGGGAVDRLWAGLRARLVAAGFDDAPERLSPPDALETAWLAPDLLLAQTCGYPLCHALAGKVRYVGTPLYSVEGTDGADYRSALVVRSDDPAQRLEDLRGRRAAYNSVSSQSGYNAFRDAVAPLAKDGRFFSETLATGSHPASLAAVIAGRADIAAIDPVSLRLQSEGIRNAVRIIGWTAAAPGLPFITMLTRSDESLVKLRAVLAAFFGGPAIADHPEFHFSGFAVLSDEAYQRVLALEHRAVERSYPLLA